MRKVLARIIAGLILVVVGSVVSIVSASADDLLPDVKIKETSCNPGTFGGRIVVTAWNYHDVAITIAVELSPYSGPSHYVDTLSPGQTDDFAFNQLTGGTYTATVTNVSNGASTSTTAELPPCLPTSPTCEAVLFIGARGSGESFAGYGATVGRVRDRLATGLIGQGQTLKEIDLSYVAHDVSVIFNPGLQTYLDGVSDGVSELVFQLKRQVEIGCGGQKIILAGYSQGALVVHQALERLATEQRNDILQRVRKVILIADPARVSNTATSLKGGIYKAASQSGSGIYTQVFGSADIPSAVTLKTVTLCYAKDIICDPSKFDVLKLYKPATWPSLAKQVSLHTSYKDDAVLDWAGANAVVAAL